MKKAIITVVLVIGMIANTFGQLNSNAESFKGTKVYEKIKFMAVNKWEDNHKMVVYEINKQCDAALDINVISKESDKKRDIVVSAMTKWSDKINGEYYYNWSMVLYEYKKQFKASSSY